MKEKPASILTRISFSSYTQSLSGQHSFHKKRCRSLPTHANHTSIVLPIDPVTITTLTSPCIGAFIGYLTNKIAISMLFRPLRPWHVLGLRVPMTPGVIPSKREALADNIGTMVGRHLLTSQDIGGAISAEPFQEHLARLVDQRITELLRRDLDPLPKIIPGRFRAYFQIGVKTLKYRLAMMVNAYIADPDFEKKLDAVLDARLDEVLNTPAEGLLNAESRTILCAVLNNLIRNLITDDRNEQYLTAFLVTTLRQAAAEGQSMATLLPQEMIGPVRELILKQSDVLLHRLGEHLTDPVMRGQMVKGVLTGLDHFLESMGPVGAMARGFLEPETLEGKIDEYLHNKKADLLLWLQQPEMQQRILLILEEHIDSFLDTSLNELFDKIGEDGLERFCASTSRHILAIARTDKVMDMLYQAIVSAVKDLSEQGKAPLRAVTGRLLPDNGEKALRESLKSKVLDLCRSPATERMIHRMVDSFVDSHLARPLGQLYDIVPHGVRKGGVTFSIMAINRILLQEVPGIVRSLNLEQVVTKKVNSLDLLQLEQLLLSIMKEQFKYINIFGALLGFLIGSVNVIIARLM